MTVIATPYPHREKFFACKAIRLLAKTCAAQEIGPTGFVLVSVIAMTEDAAGYRRAVTYFDGQLLPIVGIGCHKALSSARKRATEAGWLHYEPGCKGRVSRYWVTIPSHATGIDDNPTDEGGEDSLPMRGRIGGQIPHESGRDTPNDRPEKGRTILPVPIPNPNPNTGKSAPGIGRPDSKKPARKPSGTKGPQTLSHVTADTLRDPAKLLAWFDAQAKIPVTEESRIWTIAAACKAVNPLTKAKSPVALFVSLMKDLAKGDHSKIGDGHYDAAKLRLRELRLKQEHGITSTGPRTLAEGLADE